MDQINKFNKNMSKNTTNLTSYGKNFGLLFEPTFHRLRVRACIAQIYHNAFVLFFQARKVKELFNY